jgi:hypothetical protein
LCIAQLKLHVIRFQLFFENLICLRCAVEVH